MWVYLSSNYPVQRCLLLQQKFKANKESEKDEAAEDAQKKELEGKQKVLKGLGSIAAAQLQAMKITEAEIIASSKVDANLLGDFHAAFISSNFEYSEKSYIGAEEEFKGDENDKRKQKHSKPVDQIQIAHETSDFSTNPDYLDKLAAARATEYTR